jgi:predicted alpha/beta-hydrolase family hydrolase
MASSLALELAIDAKRASALFDSPANARACLVLAHGAGADMRHSFMRNVAEGLARRDVATFRFNFPYTERGSRRPDPPALCHATVRAAVAEAARRAPGVPLFAGGKSFGGRMTSQAQAAVPLAGVRGLVFFGFPLHAAGKPSDERAGHLREVSIPMLFLQGTRDDLAHLDLMRPLIARLRPLATLMELDDADHSFHVRASSGRTDPQVLSEMLDEVARWMMSAGAD